jgi:hypothetical protein
MVALGQVEGSSARAADVAGTGSGSVLEIARGTAEDEGAEAVALVRSHQSGRTRRSSTAQLGADLLAIRP